MRCEHCHVPMIEKPPAREIEDPDEQRVIVLTCPQCGYTEDQPLITSFWRRLAA
ncbi:MAG TPA: hypothetical protein VJR03_07565 [Nitrospira sp.]|nr:hypothetical protein [Nitrospira sp.]